MTKKTTKKTAPSNDVVIMRETLFALWVCSPLPVEEIEARLTPAGTTRGWKFAGELESGDPNPIACSDNPETHKHWVFTC